MTTLVVINAAVPLDLDGAAALLQAGFGADPDDASTPEARWAGLPRGGEESARSAEPAGLGWLFPDARRSALESVSADALADAARRLIDRGAAYGCDCSEERLRARTAEALARDEVPRYDGRCRQRQIAGSSRLRIRGGPDGAGDRSLGDALPLGVVLAGGRWERLIVDRRCLDIAGAAVAASRALGAVVPDVEVGPVFVGPDGASLWRPGGPGGIETLRDQGYEAAGIRRYLARARAAEVLALDRRQLDADNRMVLLGQGEAQLLPRFRSELGRRGIELSDRASRDAWLAVRPRLRRLADAGAFLDFLRPSWEPQALDGRDVPQLERLAGALASSPPTGGDELANLLEGLARNRDELHDLRRVLRWAIAGQEIAPPVSTVWELLAGAGPDRLIRSLELARGSAPGPGSAGGGGM